MRKVVLDFIVLLFLPRGAPKAYSEVAREAKAKDLAKCGLFAFGVFLLAEGGAVVYSAWVLTTLLFVLYQYLYVFAHPIQRPVHYEEISLIGLILVIANHVAVAALCEIGWLGIGLQAFCGFYLARTVGRFAVAREIRKIVSAVRREYVGESLEKRAQIADWMLMNRVEEVQGF